MTKVIFRKLQGEILAIFPEMPGDSNPVTCLCYAHIGQHGAAQAVALGQPAKPEEYADLLKELESIGYADLKICKRMTYADFKIRQAAPA